EALSTKLLRVMVVECVAKIAAPYVLAFASNVQSETVSVPVLAVSIQIAPPHVSDWFWEKITPFTLTSPPVLSNAPPHPPATPPSATPAPHSHRVCYCQRGQRQCACTGDIEDARRVAAGPREAGRAGPVDRERAADRQLTQSERDGSRHREGDGRAARAVVHR